MWWQNWWITEQLHLQDTVTSWPKILYAGDDSSLILISSKDTKEKKKHSFLHSNRIWLLITDQSFGLLKGNIKTENTASNSSECVQNISKLQRALMESGSLPDQLGSPVTYQTLEGSCGHVPTASARIPVYLLLRGWKAIRTNSLTMSEFVHFLVIMLDWLLNGNLF